MRDYQILTKLTKEENELIEKKAKEIGLPKSTFVRFVTLNAVQDV